MDSESVSFLRSVSAGLNTREVAIGIWIAVVLVWGMFSQSVRTALSGVIRAILNKQLLVLFLGFAFNVGIIAWLLSKIALWTTDQLTSTILWFFLSGSVLLTQVFNIREDQGYFKKLFWSGVSIVGVFEFLVVASTFSLLFELFLVPILAFVGGMYAMSSIKKEYSSIKPFLEVILVGFVIFILWITVGEIRHEPEKFFTSTTGRNFILPGLLSIGSIPFLYILYCFSHLRQARIIIGLKTFQSEELKKYAYKRFRLIFMARPWLLKRAVRQFQSLPAKTNEDVDEIVHQIYQFERDAENPPNVAESVGWNPYFAREFLAGMGLRTNDYHKGFEEEYWGAAEYVDLDDHIFPSMATYYIEGHRGVVTCLKLTGKFLDEFDATNARLKLITIASDLLQSALNISHIEASRILDQLEDNVHQFKTTEIKVSWKRYPNEKGEEVYITLRRGKEK